MKKTTLIVLLCTLSQLLSAQSSQLFIFDNFYNAKVFFKNRSVTAASMNYDAMNGKMFFKDGGEVMELTNVAQIDSVVWAGKRKFVAANGSFQEEVKMPNGTVLIQWRLKNVNVGAAGALGATTQAKVEKVNIRAMSGVYSFDNTQNSADLYKQKNDNDYYISVGGKLKKISSMKHVLKAFPNHEENIKAFVDKEDIKMEDPAAVLQLLDYCMGLK